MSSPPGPRLLSRSTVKTLSIAADSRRTERAYRRPHRSAARSFVEPSGNAFGSGARRSRGWIIIREYGRVIGERRRERVGSIDVGYFGLELGDDGRDRLRTAADLKVELTSCGEYRPRLQERQVEGFLHAPGANALQGSVEAAAARRRGREHRLLANRDRHLRVQAVGRQALRDHPLDAGGCGVGRRTGADAQRVRPERELVEAPQPVGGASGGARHDTRGTCAGHRHPTLARRGRPLAATPQLGRWAPEQGGC